MRNSVIASILAAHVSATDLAPQFLDYIVQHGKSYATVEEFERRSSLFSRSDRLIAEENALQLGYKLAHNKFSDWTREEYQKLLGYKPSEDESIAYEELPVESIDASDAEPIDWRTSGAVT